MRDFFGQQLNSQPGLGRLTRRQLTGLMLLFFVISAVFFVLDSRPQPQKLYQPEQSTQFRLIRAIESVDLLYPPVLVGDTAVFVGTLDSAIDQHIIAIDIPNGQTIWTVDVDTQSEPDWWLDDFEWNYPFSWDWGPIAADDSLVFISDSFFLTTSLTAYALADGQEIWQQQMGFVNGSPVKELSVVEQYVAARIEEPGYAELFVVEAADGSRKVREVDSVPGLFWLENGENGRRYYATQQGIQVQGRTPWAFPFLNEGITALLLPDQIILHARLPEGEGTAVLFALDRESGITLWHLDVLLVSHVERDENVGFAVSVENQLLAIDLETGSVVSILDFNQPLRQFGPEFPIFVAAGSGKTAVYHQSTQQLLIFEFSINP